MRKVLGIKLEPKTIERFKALKTVLKIENDYDLFERMLQREISALNEQEKAAFEALIRAWEGK